MTRSECIRECHRYKRARRRKIRDTLSKDTMYKLYWEGVIKQQMIIEDAKTRGLWRTY